jgi:hypothetical protein
MWPTECPQAQSRRRVIFYATFLRTLQCRAFLAQRRGMVNVCVGDET